MRRISIVIAIAAAVLLTGRRGKRGESQARRDRELHGRLGGSRHRLFVGKRDTPLQGQVIPAQNRRAPPFGDVGASKVNANGNVCSDGSAGANVRLRTSYPPARGRSDGLSRTPWGTNRPRRAVESSGFRVQQSGDGAGDRIGARDEIVAPGARQHLAAAARRQQAPIAPQIVSDSAQSGCTFG